MRFLSGTTSDQIGESYTYIHTRARTHAHTNTHAHTHRLTHTHTHARTHAHTHTRTHTRHARTHTHTHAHTHTPITYYNEFSYRCKRWWRDDGPARKGGKVSGPREAAHDFARTRYCFTSKLYCGSQSSFYCPLPLAKPTRLQYYCTPIAQYTPPHRPPFCMPYTIQYW